MTGPLLEARGLQVGYGRVPVIHGVDVTVGEGEFVVLLGANGAGKTTLLRALSQVLRPTAGDVCFAGDPLRGRRPAEVARLGLAHVPEGRRVFPDLTVLGNLEMGGYHLLSDSSTFRATLEGVYALFPRLAERRDQRAGSLSGGEAQMLAIGRALMSRPRLLMLDEPSLGLAPRLVAETFRHLRTLHQERGVSLLLVEQAATLALQVAQRGYVLDRGRMVLAGTSAELQSNDVVREVHLGAGGRRRSRQ